MEISLASLNLHTTPPTLFHRSPSLKFNHIISLNRRNSRISIPRTKSPAPARDIMIDFGRYKGKMLGTLPSSYLKWVSTNLRARDSEHWAILADLVLADPIYKDRIEWEFVENLLNGNNNVVLSQSLLGNGKVSDLLAEVSERFGWDNDDKLGWSRIDFAFLGTSKGPRIPRIVTRSSVSGSENAMGVLKENAQNNGVDGSNRRNDKRSERRERLRMKRLYGEKTGSGLGFADVDEDNTYDNYVMTDNHSISASSITSPFPGRESLLLLNIRHSLIAAKKEKDNPHI